MKATDHDGLWMADLTIRWLRSMVSSNTKLRCDTAEAHKSESASKKTFESDWKGEKQLEMTSSWSVTAQAQSSVPTFDWRATFTELSDMIIEHFGGRRELPLDALILSDQVYIVCSDYPPSRTSLHVSPPCRNVGSYDLVLITSDISFGISCPLIWIRRNVASLHIID